MKICMKNATAGCKFALPLPVVRPDVKHEQGLALFFILALSLCFCLCFHLCLGLGLFLRLLRLRAWSFTEVGRQLELLQKHHRALDALELGDLLSKLRILFLKILNILRNRSRGRRRCLLRRCRRRSFLSHCISKPLEHLLVLFRAEKMLVLHRGDQRHVITKEAGVRLVIPTSDICLLNALHSLEQLCCGCVIKSIILWQVEDGFIELVEILSYKPFLALGKGLQNPVQVHGTQAQDAK
mmetsp:Transcript_15637/g.28002  ORF Transcript_15637/g.28002 Transcript_15637/m.28002 type:complete len:240 (+) Transcript_15637:2662-3381(+)